MHRKDHFVPQLLRNSSVMREFGKMFTWVKNIFPFCAHSVSIPLSHHISLFCPFLSCSFPNKKITALVTACQLGLIHTSGHFSFHAKWTTKCPSGDLLGKLPFTTLFGPPLSKAEIQWPSAFSGASTTYRPISKAGLCLFLMLTIYRESPCCL